MLRSNRQTAMSDVLEAVGTARLDIQPVLDRVVEHAQRLCHDTNALVSLRELDVFIAASAGPMDGSPDFDNTPRPEYDALDHDRRGVRDRRAGSHPRLARGTARSVSQLPGPQHPGPVAAVAPPSRATTKSSACSPSPGRAAGGFSDAEVSLLQAFTDQASIAINNGRLLHEIEVRNTELSESLELQTASSEVLQLISANPGELTVVLEGLITPRGIAL